MKLFNFLVGWLSSRVAVILTYFALPSIWVTANAIDKTDLTQDTSGGKSLSDAFSNIETTTQEGSTLAIAIAAFVGLVMGITSVVVLYKASKDDSRERPAGAVFGLIAGGLMFSIAIIMWYVSNTVTGA